MNLVRAELQKFKNAQTLALLDEVAHADLSQTLGAELSHLRPHSDSERMLKLVDALERVVQLVEEMERAEERTQLAARDARESGRYDLSENHRLYAARLRATRRAITQAMTAAFAEQ